MGGPVMARRDPIQQGDQAVAAAALQDVVMRMDLVRDERDDLIRRAHAGGMPVAQIAQNVGMTPARIYQLVGKGTN
jgi:hypothetical protein